jgi:hypothetical protein
MSNLKLIVNTNFEKDIELIKEFFFNSETEHFKWRILRFYCGLEENISNSKEPAIVIEDYFNRIYLNKKDEIKSIVEQSRKIIEEEFSEGLEILVKMMNYDVFKKETFIAFPTLLPFSPTNRPTFYFSIVSTLFNKSPNHILDIAIHEISHFLLFDILEDLKINLRIVRENQDFLHFFKEALTGMLLSEKEIAKLLDRKDYKGNPEVHNLNIKVFNQTTTLREYLRSTLHQYQEKGLSFSQFIKDVIDQLRPKVKEFSNKKIFWNQNEREIRDGDEKLSKEYAVPIVI